MSLVVRSESAHGFFRVLAYGIGIDPEEVGYLGIRVALGGET